MSRAVHLLKLYVENTDRFTLLREANVYEKLFRRKYYNDTFRRLINDFNQEIDVSEGPLLYKGLSLPRLKILMALLAQNDNVILPLNSTWDQYYRGLYIIKTPKRFKDKFLPLLANGFYLLGTMIEDSLHEDPTINCNNPFGFELGDLGFWWAGVVILDYVKYITDRSRKELNHHLRCTDFYNDPCMSRKYKYNQNSALSHLNRIPLEFLGEEDNINFSKTIDIISYDEERFFFSDIWRSSSLWDEIALDKYGMTAKEGYAKYFDDED